MKANEMKRTKEAALEWIANGGRCVKKHGVWNRWGEYGCKDLTADDARHKVVSGEFGFDDQYWRLKWVDYPDGNVVLGFDEPADSDLW